jgi:RND family efflux transporter MFP subunit
MKSVIHIILSLMIVTGLWSCSSDSSAEQAVSESKAIPVRTKMLKSKPFSEYLRITGTVKAKNRVNIVVEESGTLKGILKEKGSYVRQGEILAILENSIIKATFDDAAAALKMAEVNYKSSQVLFDKKAISENDFLNAKYGLDRAQAQYDLAKSRFDKLNVIAPTPGFINDRYHDLGAYLMATTPLFDLIDNSRVKITAGVAERFRSYIQKETPAIITFDAYPEMKIDGKVTFVHQSINPENRTFQVEIEIPNPDRKLAPDMIANLKILRQSYENKIVVPVDAVIDSEDGRYVFIEKSSVAKKVPVEILVIYEASILVDGLEEDQHLVIVGHQDLTEGDSVMVVQN